MLDKTPTREPTPEPAKQKKFKLKLQLAIMNEILANENDVND